MSTLTAIEWIIVIAAALFIGVAFVKLMFSAVREIRQYRAFARQTRANRLFR